MIVGAYEKDGKQILIVNITRFAVEQLMAGKAILLTHDNIPHYIKQDEEMHFVFSETEEDFLRVLKEKHAVGPGTTVTDSRTFTEN